MLLVDMLFVFNFVSEQVLVIHEQESLYTNKDPDKISLVTDAHIWIHHLVSLNNVLSLFSEGVFWPSCWNHLSSVSMLTFIYIFANHLKHIFKWGVKDDSFLKLLYLLNETIKYCQPFLLDTVLLLFFHSFLLH